MVTNQLVETVPVHHQIVNMGYLKAAQPEKQKDMPAPCNESMN
jgi:hypothetical protein